MVGLQLVWQLNAEALAPVNSIPKIAQKLWIDCAVCKFITSLPAGSKLANDKLVHPGIKAEEL